jgi:hypothetical protein
MHCAFCHQPIDRLNAWKGAAGFYCSEFCAEEFGLDANGRVSLPPLEAARRTFGYDPRA